MMLGMATAIMVEFSGANTVARATAASRRCSAPPGGAIPPARGESPPPGAGGAPAGSVSDDTDGARTTVDLHDLAVADGGRRHTGADHGRDAVFPRDDGT